MRELFNTIFSDGAAPQRTGEAARLLVRFAVVGAFVLGVLPGAAEVFARAQKGGAVADAGAGRAELAVSAPNAASVPVPMSCTDMGWITGVSTPPCATMRPLRAWSSGSNPGVSWSGPAPHPSMWQCTRPGFRARSPGRSSSSSSTTCRTCA